MKYQVNRIDPDDTTKQLVDILDGVIKVEYLYKHEIRFYLQDKQVSYAIDWIIGFKEIK